MGLRRWRKEYLNWIEDLRNRLVVTEPLYSHMSKAYLLPMAAILVWGWYCSGNSTDGLPFARAGALVTTLSVVFIAWRLRRSHFGGFMTAPVVGLTKSYKEMETEAAAVFDKVRTFSILLGTFIWGFGDLIYIYSHKGIFHLVSAVFFFGAPPKP
jgi:hypothetical protein